MIRKRLNRSSYMYVQPISELMREEKDEIDDDDTDRFNLCARYSHVD